MIAHLEQNLGGARRGQETSVFTRPTARRPGSQLASQQWEPDASRPSIASKPSISPSNAAALAFLADWRREPDDKGEEWWSAFEEELKRNHTFKERGIK